MSDKRDKRTKTVTAKTIDALRPRAGRYSVNDSEIPGLQLRISPDGTRSWCLRFRLNGLDRRYTLGAYPAIPLAKARTMAKSALGKVADKVDLVAKRRTERSAARTAQQAAQQARRNSFDVLATEYIERHAKPRKRTWRDDQSKINREILPRWRGRPVTSITRRDVHDLVNGIADRGAPVLANRTLALISRVLRYAVDTHVIDANPAARIAKPGVEFSARPPEEREQKPYTAEEIERIWSNTKQMGPGPRALYRMGLLLGQRPGEISGLLWTEIDGQWWKLPAERSKNRRPHRVFLPPTVVDLLSGVPKVKDQAKVFAGIRGKRQIAELNRVAFAGVRARTKPRHACRDTVASMLAEMATPIEEIAAVLNHSFGPNVTLGYIAAPTAHDAAKTRAMLAIEQRVLVIVGEHEDEQAKVVPFASHQPQR